MKTVKAPALFPRGLTAGEAESGEVRADGKEPHDMGEAAGLYFSKPSLDWWIESKPKGTAGSLEGLTVYETSPCLRAA